MDDEEAEPTMSLTEQNPTAQAGAAPDEPTSEELIERARALRPRLRELQAEHARLGSYSEEIHEYFTRNRLYDILRPRRYGGLELGLETFFKVVVEIARADPGVAWSFELGASHPFQFSSYFPERSQEEAYQAYPFVSASRAFPLASKIEKVEGGFRVSGRWDYCSGCTWSSHFMPVAPVTQEDGSQVMYMFILPRKDFTILDDWGEGKTIGLHASSSNTITIEDAFVPDYNAVVYDFKDHEWGEKGTPGYELLGNPLYLGRTVTIFIAGLVSSQIGAAWASLDEYERLLERGSSFPPRIPRTESPEYQLWYGQIQSLTDAADTLFHATISKFVRMHEEWTRGGPPVGVKEDARLRGHIIQAARLAGEAIDLAFAHAGTSSAALAGTKLQKYYQDAAMFRTHIGAQWDVLLAAQARTQLGKPLTM